MGPPVESSAPLVASPALMARVDGCRVAVLYGGQSAEREVSMVSGPAVVDALRGLGDGVGPREVLDLEIAADGKWMLDGQSLSPQVAVDRLAEDTLFFLGLHGGDGEDGTIQGFLNLAGRRHTGSGLAASALCMNKHATRVLCAQAGLRVAEGALVTPDRWASERDDLLKELWRAAGGEAVAKPNCGGSSVSTAHVRSETELATALETIFDGGDDALVEAWTHGLEATVGVVGNRGRELRALPVVEIRPREGHFFDYAEKYGDDGATETCPPRELDDESIARLTCDALQAYRSLGCDGYARADFIVPRDGGAPVLLEVNTLPGFTPRSLLPQAAAVAGTSFASLCLELCALALDGSGS